MYVQVENSKENKGRTVANSVVQNKNITNQILCFKDNRPEVSIQSNIYQMMVQKSKGNHIPSFHESNSIETGGKRNKQFGAYCNELTHPIQMFKEIVLAGRQVKLFQAPKGPQYTFYNLFLNDLKGKLLDYNAFEQNVLDFVDYQKETIQIKPLNLAIEKLNALEESAKKALLRLLDPAYQGIRADISDVITTVRADRLNFHQKLQGAIQKINDAGQAAWFLWQQHNFRIAPTSDALADGFNRARDVGIVSIFLNKWWSSHNFPGPNAELYIYVNGELWSIVHVKWDNKFPITFENVSMVNFKKYDGTSIQNSIITNIRAKNYLISEALKYESTAPPPSSGDTAMF